MVRVKHRYLLGHLLFPTDGLAKEEKAASLPLLPDVVSLHRPAPVGFTAQDLRRVIISSILENFGEYGGGAASPGLQVKYFSPATSTFIIKTHRDHYRLVWAAMTLITRLPLSQQQHLSSQPKQQSKHTACVVVQVVRVSGTIVKAEEEAIRRARDMLRRAQNAGMGASSEGMLGIVLGAGVEGGAGGGSEVVVDDDTDDDEDEEDGD